MGVEQPAPLGQSDQRSGGVEQIDDQKGQNDGDQSALKGAGDVHPHERRGQAWRQRENAAEIGYPQGQGDGGDGQNGDDHGAGDTRAPSTTMRTNPAAARSTSGLLISPKVTSVTG